jgi:ADP-ribosylglycohydrolase
MLGAIVGDIVGSVYERHNIKTKEFPLFRNDCHFTDDTVMTCAVAEAIMNGEKADDFIDAMKKYGRMYPKAGYGKRFSVWLFSDDRKPLNSYGNGSAMRVIPVGWYAKSLDEALGLAKITAEVTHNHEEGIKGAQCVAAVIYLIRQGKSKKAIKKFVEENFGYNLSRSYNNLYKNHKFECTCQNSVPASIICWLDANDYMDCIRKAVSLGGDADTEAAIAGAFAGAMNDDALNDEFVNDVIRFFSMDFLDMLKKFHEKYEK